MSARDRPARPWLLAAGALSLGIAVLHAVIIVVGPPAYIYFGAADLAPLAASGSLVPALLTAALSGLFGVWAWYAFAGAGVVRHPPLLRIGLWVIGAIYTLRGLAFVPESIGLVRGGAVPPRFVVFSLVSLVAGILYLIGAWRSSRGDKHARSSS